MISLKWKKRKKKEKRKENELFFKKSQIHDGEWKFYCAMCMKPLTKFTQ